MLTKQILEKVAQELPSKASDLKEALLMLIDIIDETNQDLVDLSQKGLEEKEYQSSIKLINLMEELDKCREKIVKQVVDFDIEGGEDELEVLDNNSKAFSENKDKVDYSLYTVDNELVHNLNETYKFKRPMAFLWQGKKYYANNFKAILLKVANILLDAHSDDFRKLSDHKKFTGRKNRMISSNPKELLDPKLLDDKITYIHSCLSSDAIVRLISKFLDYFGYDKDDFMIYLRADYNDLHE